MALSTVSCCRPDGTTEWYNLGQLDAKVRDAGQRKQMPRQWRTFDGLLRLAVGLGAAHLVGGVGTVGIGVAAELVGHAVARGAAELLDAARAVELVAKVAAVVLAVARLGPRHAPGTRTADKAHRQPITFVNSGRPTFQAGGYNARS